MTNTHWKGVEKRFDEKFDADGTTSKVHLKLHFKSFLKDEIEQAYQTGIEDAVKLVSSAYYPHISSDQWLMNIEQLVRQASEFDRDVDTIIDSGATGHEPRGRFATNKPN